MEAIGNNKPVVIRVPQPASQPILSSASSKPAIPILGGGAIDFDSKDSESLRYEQLKAAIRNVPKPLGNQSFTLFKDVTGQVITRFRNAESGKVVYIPEPNILRLANLSSGQSAVNITA